MGGFQLLLQHNSKESMLNMLTGRKLVLENWFEWICPRGKEKDLINPGRLIWVSLEGIPLHARAEDTFFDIAKGFGHVVEVEDLSIQKVQTHIARVYILTSSFMTISEVVRLEIQGQAFSVCVLEDTAVIIDFGPRYEADDAVDSMKDPSDEGRTEAGSDGGSDSGSFVLESPASARAKLNGPESNMEDRVIPIPAIYGETTAILGTLNDNKKASFYIEATTYFVDHNGVQVVHNSDLANSAN